MSQFVTLLLGDLTFIGTRGTTQAMEASKPVEIELEGVGVLPNKVPGVGE